MNNASEQKDKKLWEFYQVGMRDKFIQARPRFDFLIKLIKSLKKSGKHLDIGLGDGYFLESMSKSGYECFGMDLAEESISTNEKKFKDAGLKIILKSGNINNISFDDNSIDIITASEVLEHLNDDDIKMGINEIYRCLSVEGIFVGTVPADENLNDNICFCPNCEEVFHRWGHKQTFNKGRLQKLFLEKFQHAKVIKIPSIPYKPNLLEFIKFKIKLVVNSIKTETPYIGNYIVIAKK